MIRYYRIAVLLVSPFPVFSGQAAVEAALAAGGAATAAGRARKTGKAIADTLENTGQTLQQRDASKPQAHTSGVRAKPIVVTVERSATPPGTMLPHKAFESPSGIEEGMDYSEVERRFGPPSLKLTAGSGDVTLCFTAKELTVDVTVRNGKVIAVRRASGPTG